MQTSLRKELFSKLFSGDDWIVAGNKYCKHPELMGNVLYTYENPEYYTVNPIHPRLDFRSDIAVTPGSRAAINVTKLKNFLFEFDDMPLKLQLKFLLEDSGIPWTGIVFSGGKSYHAILSLEEPIEGAHTIEGVNRYKIIHQRLAAFLNNRVKATQAGLWEVDNSTKDPARLTRFPNSFRKGIEQKIMHIGKEMSPYDFNILIDKCPLITTRKTVIVPPECSADSKEKFWHLCPEGLRREVRYPKWSKPQGNYTKIFKLSLWAIDATDVTKEVWLSILHKYTFPWLDRKGYMSDPEKGVHDAFTKKGK